MEPRIEEYTVGELARAAGVSVRLLHHYDAIGLLKPAHVAANGYRLYRRAEALRLQEILFYRAMGMPLGQIADVLADGAPVDRLVAHRERLARDLAGRAGMLAALDRTISHLSGDTPMAIEDLYKPFSAQQQAEYETWLKDTYGPGMTDALDKSRDRFASENHEDGLARLRDIEAALVAAYEAGQSPDQADLADHQDWVADMWGYACDRNAYGKLSEIYLAHPDFIARFETLSKGFSQWLCEAMVAWSKRA